MSRTGNTSPGASQPLVNLLPWRARRRRARLRFWLLFLIGDGVLLCAIAGYWHQHIRRDNQRLAYLISQQQPLNQALNQQLRRALAHAQQQQALLQQRQQQQAQQQQTAAWRPLLEQLAEQLPAAAWLNSIDYQQAQLRISGYSYSARALQSVSRQLATLPGFTLASPADIKFIDGKWQFSFRLMRKRP